MNYIRHNFSYVLCSFSHAKCSFRGIWKKQTILALPKSFERCMLLVDCIRYICRGVWHTPLRRQRLCGNAMHAKGIGNARNVGAYGIRPSHRRTNRVSNCRRNIANPCNSGRMAYAHHTAAQTAPQTAGAISQIRAIQGVWHTPITPPHKTRLKLPAQYRKSVQFRAYAIRPYGGSGYAETQCMPRELEMREM